MHSNCLARLHTQTPQTESETQDALSYVFVGCITATAQSAQPAILILSPNHLQPCKFAIVFHRCARGNNANCPTRQPKQFLSKRNERTEFFRQDSVCVCFLLIGNAHKRIDHMDVSMKQQKKKKTVKEASQQINANGRTI